MTRSTVEAFLAWLLCQDGRDDPIGDLARDLLADPRARRFASLSSLDAYLQEVGACAAACSARDAAWREWSALPGAREVVRGHRDAARGHGADPKAAERDALAAAIYKAATNDEREWVILRLSSLIGIVVEVEKAYRIADALLAAGYVKP